MMSHSEFLRVAEGAGLVVIHPGVFQMGAAEPDRFANDTERPAHRVSIGYSFGLGRFPVTVAEYRRFMPLHAPNDAPDLPAVNVTWEDASAYCQWLGNTTGHAFRLPTEVEWEYACRAGGSGLFSVGDLLKIQDANFLFSEYGERIGIGRRTPEGSYPPNAFGVQEMHGNVCEWVADDWHSSYQGAPVDGSAWVDAGLSSESTSRRTIRGGAWDYMPRLLRSSWRDWLLATGRRDNLGFRIALTLESNT